jgi:hypothetical protein
MYIINTKFKNKRFLVLLVLTISTITSCITPYTSIRVSNKTNNDIYIQFILKPELFLEDFINDNNIKYYNNLVVEKNKTHTLISMFGFNILKRLGFSSVRKNNDIINAINEIFIDINVYKIINDEYILLYNKDYIINEYNLSKWRSPAFSLSLIFNIVE